MEEKEFREKKFDLFSRGISLAKEALSHLDGHEVSDEEKADVDLIMTVFALRGTTLIEMGEENAPMEKKLEQLHALWALAVSLYALGIKHESTEESSTGKG